MTTHHLYILQSPYAYTIFFSSDLFWLTIFSNIYFIWWVKGEKREEIVNFNPPLIVFNEIHCFAKKIRPKKS